MEIDGACGRQQVVARGSGELDHGAVVIAAITSCTNTSNPTVMIAAGLLAKNAVERGLKRRPWVKSSLAPGSKVVTEYYDINTLPSGDQWMTVTTKVEDPEYFVRHYLTTSDFLKLPNNTGWAPTPCSAR